MERTRRTYIAAAAVANLLWSGSLVASKLSYGSLGPMSLGLTRFVLGSIVLLLLVHLQGFPVPERRDMGRIALTGLLGITAYYAAENLGVSMLPASTSSLVVASFPAMTLVLECGLDRTLPSMRKAIGVALAFLGVALIAVTESGGGSQPIFAGCAVLMFGGLCWSVYNFLMRPLLGSYDALVITCWQTVFGAIGFLPLALAEGMPASMPDATAWLSVAYLVLGCTVAGFLLYNVGLEGLSASTATAFANLIPVFGLVLSALVLHESISAQQLLGGAVVVGGIVLSSQDGA
jgi:drug/metabolite transporter (DMT)-like permease